MGGELVKLIDLNDLQDTPDLVIYSQDPKFIPIGVNVQEAEGSLASHSWGNLKRLVHISADSVLEAVASRVANRVSIVEALSEMEPIFVDIKDISIAQLRLSGGH